MSVAWFWALLLVAGHSEHAYFTDSRRLLQFLYLFPCICLNTVSSAHSDLFRDEESGISNPGTLLRVSTFTH
jgi:hypothetical protein